ncbi:MAG: hypothetical protein H0W09_05995 [Solirubrobacterales bacterium]|nr:hypothetical protein [Solirubrobacterales bacterium]
MSTDPRADGLRIELGPIDPELEAELSGVSLCSARVEAGARRSPRPVRANLGRVADSINGATAVNLRHRPIPWAYRVFFRHIGLDPDESRTPVEQASFERIAHGGLRSRGLPADALMIATLETHVAVRAFDDDQLDGLPGVRGSRPGERLEGRPGELPEGTLVIADRSRVLSLLFGLPAASVEVAKTTEASRICALGVSGVPAIALEEAIWVVAELMSA